MDIVDRLQGRCHSGTTWELHQDAAAEIQRLREQVQLLHHATVVLRNCMGGHNHWDRTGRHGLGCEVCIQQMAGKDKARELIDAAKLDDE